jgi:hypothetical protein
MDRDSLVAVLRAHDASLDVTALKAVYDQNNAGAVAEWAKSHLTPDTLLSVDELDQ